MAQLLINSLVSCAVYSLVAYGFYLTYKTHKFFNLGHGAPVVIGGYAVFCIARFFPGSGIGELVVSIVIAAVVAGLFGLAIDQSLYRFLRRRKQAPLVLFVISLGVLTVIESLVALLFTSQYRVVDALGAFSGIIHIGSAANTLIQIVTIAVAGLVIAGVWIAIKKTNFGKAFRAISDDAEVSAIVGVPVEKIFARVSFLSAGLAGLAGALIAIDSGINPHMGFGYLLKGIVASISGGLSIIAGPLLGSFLISLLENTVVTILGAEWRDVAAFTFLLIFLLVRPQGILSQKR